MSHARPVLLILALVTAAALTAAPASAAPVRPVAAPQVRVVGLDVAMHDAVRLAFEALPEADRVHLPQILKNLDQDLL